MSALLSIVGGWWSRLLGRAEPLHGRTEAAAHGEVIDFKAAVEAAGDAAPSSTPLAAALEQTQSLMDILQLDALPPAAPPAPIDPRVRERTLAALADLRQIPALQSLAQSFLRSLNQPEVSMEEVIGAIEKDAALCVRVLKMANSVLVSPERRIEDLETAVHMLGVVRVRKAAQALFTLRDAHRVAEGFDWRHLWMHALATASIAEELEQQLRSGDATQLYLAALLHDVGKIVLSTIAPEEYRAVLVTAWNENGRLEELERERLGVDHREAGVLFARHSGMPEVVVQAIAHHDRPEQAEQFRFEVALVALANHVSKAHGLGFSGARLDATDGEFGDLSAWSIVEEHAGGPANREAIEAEMASFVSVVRADLRELHESA